MSILTIDGQRQATNVSSSYLRLIAQMPLKQISSDTEYDRAAAFIDKLSLQPTLTRGEQDYLDALIIFVQAYDDSKASILDEIEPVEMLKALMEHGGMTTNDLGKLLGSKGAASEILHGKRGISKSHMLKLATHFRVDAGVFLA